MGMPRVGIARLHNVHGQCPTARPWAMSRSKQHQHIVIFTFDEIERIGVVDDQLFAV